MAEILPNDIGLATYNDVGEVTKLRTTAKTVVEAINELYQNGGAISNIMGEQRYVDGEDNIVIGENNIVYGNGNLIIGDNNTVVGDNLNIVSDKLVKYTNANGNINFDWYDDGTGRVYYYYWEDGTYVPAFSVGDKLLLSVCKTWATENWDDFVTVESGLQIVNITEINTDSCYITIEGYDLNTAPPDDEHIIDDYIYIDYFIALNENYKVKNSNTGNIMFGGTALGTKSTAFCFASALGDYSFATSGSTAKGIYSNALCNGTSEARSSFSANHGRSYGEYSSTINQGYCYGPYGFASGYYSRVVGRPLKATSLNTTDKYIVIDSNYSVSGISKGSKLLLRCYNSYNSIIFSEPTVKSVSGNTIYLNTESSLGGSGSSAYKLFSDGIIFVFDTSTSYATSSKAGGYYSVAGGKYSNAEGYYNVAAAEGANIWGKYGLVTDSYSLALGNGTSIKNPGLAFKVLSDGSVHADAEYTTPCADYAEYFEWDDGNPQAEDRAGYFVKLCGEKIVKCGEFDKPLGIVSAKPAIIGDSGEMHWKGKFVTDDFGRVQYHDVVIPTEYNEDGDVISEEHIERQPILNPEWDSSETYIPRKDRPEWSPIGVLGKLVVYDDGTLQSGDICRPGADGIAVKSIENGYPVLKRISDDKVLVWFKE